MRPYSQIKITKSATLIACVSLVTMSALHAAMLTDNFADRPVVSGSSATFSGDSTSATHEVGEPNHGGARLHTVWGAWTAPDNGNVTITTSGSSFDTVLAIYSGTALNSLLPVSQNNDVQPGFIWSSVTFPVKVGVTYSFAVDGNPNSSFTGQGTVAVNVTHAPSSQPGSEVGTDQFSARSSLPSALRVIGVCDTRLASTELNEPPHVGARGHSVWWKWIAPSNGVVTIDTLGSAFDTALTIYVGTNLTSLSEIAINNDAVNVVQSQAGFRAGAGQEYQIVVDGSPDSAFTGQGNLILNLSLSPDFDPGTVPGFDVFDKRATLAGTNARGVANNSFFGLDVNESNHGSARNHTTWWRWTAPVSGPVVISTEGSDFDTFLAVYTGDSLSALQLVVSNNNVSNALWSQAGFSAQRGVDYQIMVDGSPNSAFTGQGNIALSVNQAVSPLNTLAIYPAVELELPGNADVSYQLQASSDLITWEDIGKPIVGQGQPIRTLDSTRGTNKKFYRYLTLP